MTVDEYPRFRFAFLLYHFRIYRARQVDRSPRAPANGRIKRRFRQALVTPGTWLCHPALDTPPPPQYCPRFSPESKPYPHPTPATLLPAPPSSNHSTSLPNLSYLCILSYSYLCATCPHSYLLSASPIVIRPSHRTHVIPTSFSLPRRHCFSTQTRDRSEDIVTTPSAHSKHRPHITLRLARETASQKGHSLY